MAIHKDLPDSQLHEPKGVATATADKVYISDGLGSGSWDKLNSASVNSADVGNYYTGTTVEAILQEIREQDPSGWCTYTDATYTSSTELDITDSGTGTQITNDGNTTIETNAPRDMTSSLWNSSTNKIEPINENDFYIVRLDFKSSTSTGTLNYLTLDLDIGGSIGSIWSYTFVPDKGVDEKYSFAIPFYTGSTFFSNGGTFKLLKNGSGTFKIQDIGVTIARTHRGR